MTQPNYELRRLILKTWNKKRTMAEYRRVAEKLGITVETVRNQLVRMEFGENLPPKSEKPGTPTAKAEPLSPKVLAENALLKQHLKDMEGVKDNISVFKIKPKGRGRGETEGVVVAVASDWHVEELVKPEWVNGTNEYNLEISKFRAEEFFRNALRLSDIVRKDLKVHTMVLPLLGDFITNCIHPEMMEVNILPPAVATQKAQSYLASGIKFLLENSDLDLLIPCATGNHGRTTKKPHQSTEFGHSWEHLMYNNLKEYFEDEPRVKFIINESYLTIVDVLGFKMRMHHGHEIRYQGGVGGVYIPINKKIAQWNKSITVNLDVFGHHHALKHGGNFIANGSMIGYNPYAMRGGFDFEKPKQAFFVIDKKRGLTWFAPILFSK